MKKDIKITEIPPLSFRVRRMTEGLSGFDKIYDPRCWTIPEVPYDHYDVGDRIPHHKPKIMYRYLWTYDNTYPIRKKFKTFCSHNECAIVEVHDSDPGWMTTDYAHLVCTRCGKRIKAGSLGSIVDYLLKHGNTIDSIAESWSKWRVN